MSAERLLQLEAERPPAPSRVCTVKVLLDQVTPEEREILERWLAMPVNELGHQRISTDIEDAYGEHITNITIGRHRRGGCQCRRSS